MDATKEREARAEPLKVNIFNQPYHLRSDGDGEYVRELARFVDERMQAISSHTAIVDYAKVAVLAALNIADELHRLKLEASGPTTEGATQTAASEAESEQSPPADAAAQSRGDAGDSWSYSDIFEALPARESSLPKLGQNITTRLRQLREESGPASPSEKDE